MPIHTKKNYFFSQERCISNNSGNNLVFGLIYMLFWQSLLGEDGTTNK